MIGIINILSNNKEFKLINANINKFLFVLILVFPSALISGPFFPDLISCLASIIIIYLFFQKSYKKYFYNYKIIIFLIFYLALILSSIFSKNIYFSLSASLFYFRFYLFALAIWIVLDNFNLKYFFFSILLPFLIIFLDASYQYIYEVNILGYQIAEQYRVSSLFLEELKMGSYIIRLLPILVAIFFVSYGRINNFNMYLISIILIFFYLILISGERTALFMFICFIVSVFIILFIKNKLKSLIFIVTPFFVFLPILYFDHNLFNRLIYRTFEQLNLLNDFFKISEINLFTHHHEKIYLSSIALFKENIIFGIGPKMFRINCADLISDNYSCSSHPHNFYLQILAETGIIGFVIFLFIFFLFILNFIKFFNFKKQTINYFQYFALFSLIVQLLPILPSGNFFNNWLSLIMFYSLGYYFYGSKQK